MHGRASGRRLHATLRARPSRIASKPRATWRAERSWPPEGCEERALHLDDGDRLAEAPGGDGIDMLKYQPGVGMQAGLRSVGQLLSLPGDQRPDEALSRVYTSQPLDEPLAVLGRAARICGSRRARA